MNNKNLEQKSGLQKKKKISNKKNLILKMVGKVYMKHL